MLRAASIFNDFYQENRYMVVTNLLDQLQKKGAKIEELNIANILNSDYEELMEQAKVFRKEDLLEYILTHLVRTEGSNNGLTSNIIQIFRSFAMYLAGDTIANNDFFNRNFESLFQKIISPSSQIPIESVVSVFEEVLECVENGSQLDLYAQLLYY